PVSFLHRPPTPSTLFPYTTLFRSAGGTGAEPPLLLIGSPMGAPGFTTLAGHFTDRTVVTYDPRGAERSERTDGAAETAVEEHAEDRKSTRLNSSHVKISYAVFCLK